MMTLNGSLRFIMLLAIQALLPIVLACTQAVVPARASAGGSVLEMYPDAELVKDKTRYEQRIGDLFSYGLWEFIYGVEKLPLSGIRIELPLKGRSPLDAYVYKKDGVPTVVLPVLTLKFIEDLSLAYAWRFENEYSLEPVDVYIAMLKYRRPEDFPGARVPDPLTALGVPPRIWEEDKEVDELSLRFRNTAWAFILAHELSHLIKKHPSNAEVDPKVSQRNEMEADAFAMELLSRSDTIPMGMILWFQASVGYFPNRADFATEAEYYEWMQKQATHPVNPERLRRLGDELNRAADSTLNPSHGDALRFIAEKVVKIGDTLASPDMQRFITRCAVLGNPEDLKRLHDSPCDERLQ